MAKDWFALTQRSAYRRKMERLTEKTHDLLRISTNIQNSIIGLSGKPDGSLRYLIETISYVESLIVRIDACKESEAAFLIMQLHALIDQLSETAPYVGGWASLPASGKWVKAKKRFIHHASRYCRYTERHIRCYPAVDLPKPGFGDRADTTDTSHRNSRIEFQHSSGSDRCYSASGDGYFGAADLEDDGFCGSEEDAGHPNDPGRFDDDEEIPAQLDMRLDYGSFSRSPRLGHLLKARSAGSAPANKEGLQRIDKEKQPTNPVPITMSSVNFSAVAPKEFAKGEYAQLSVVMYEEAYRSAVDRIRAEYEDMVWEAQSGYMPVKNETHVRITISSPETGITFDSTEERGIWTGKYLEFAFLILVSEQYTKKQIPLILQVFFEDVLATTLKMLVKCSAAAPMEIQPERRDIMTAFVSYARNDTEEVSLLVSGMEKVRPDLKIFMDVDSLRSGEDWKEKLEYELKQRDILYLCWSSSACKSHWVDFEWRYVYNNRGSEFVDPIPLESPEFCPPPTELEHKHFDDRWIKYRKRYANEFIRIRDCDNGEVSVFHKHTVVVGRTADADFRIKSADVSGNHLKISSNSENSFLVMDMGSKTGSYVKENNLAIRSEGTIVERGTEIVVGDRTIQIL